MTAKELIAAGYRLYWVTVSKTIPVLCKPEEVYRLHRAADWARDDAADWETDENPMAKASDDDRVCYAHTTADIDGAGPTIGELLDAQREAK